jgi:hypothetical protein
MVKLLALVLLSAVLVNARPVCYIQWTRDATCRLQPEMEGLESVHPLFSSQFFEDLRFTFDDSDYGGATEPTAEECIERADFWSKRCELQAKSVFTEREIATRVGAGAAGNIHAPGGVTFSSFLQAMGSSDVHSSSGGGPALSLTLFGAAVVDSYNPYSPSTPTRAPTAAPTMNQCGEGYTKIITVDFIDGQCHKFSLPKAYAFPGMPSDYWTKFNAHGTTCEEGGTWGFYIDDQCLGAPIRTPSEWDYFDPAKTNVPGGCRDTSKPPCTPVHPGVKGCYHAGDDNSLFAGLWFPTPPPTPKPAKIPNTKKYCVNSLHPHECYRYNTCSSDADCPPPYQPGAPPLQCTTPAWCSGDQPQTDSIPSWYVQLACKTPTPPTAAQDPPTKLFPLIKPTGVSTTTCKQGATFVFKGCSASTQQAFHNAFPARSNFSDQRFTGDDDDYVDPPYPHDDDTFDDDSSKKPTRKRPHLTLQKCYDPDVGYEYPGKLGGELGGGKYADECLLTTIGLRVQNDRHHKLIPSGCSVEWQGGACVRKSMCRALCLYLEASIGGLTAPCFNDGDDDGLYSDDDPYVPQLKPEWIKFDGCSECSMITDPCGPALPTFCHTAVASADPLYPAAEAICKGYTDPSTCNAQAQGAAKCGWETRQCGVVNCHTQVAPSDPLYPAAEKSCTDLENEATCNSQAGSTSKCNWAAQPCSKLLQVGSRCEHGEEHSSERRCIAQ